MSGLTLLEHKNKALDTLATLAGSPLLRIVAVATTGLKGVPVEIVVLDGAGRLLFQEFIAADRPIEPDASRINGVTDTDLKGALDACAIVTDLESTLLAPDTDIVAWTPMFIYQAFTRAGADIDARKMWKSGQDVVAPLCSAWNEARQSFGMPALGAALRDAGVDEGGLAASGSALGNAQRLQRLINWHGTAPRTGPLENLDGFCAGCGQPEQRCLCDVSYVGTGA